MFNVDVSLLLDGKARIYIGAAAPREDPFYKMCRLF